MAEETTFQRRLVQDIKNGEQELKIAQADIDKARRANIDVSEAQRKLDTASEDLERIKAVYMPDAARQE